MSYVVPMVGVWLSLTALYWTYEIGVTWPLEIHGECGTWLAWARFQMGQVPYALAVSAYITIRWLRNPYARPFLLISLFAAAVYWSVVVQRTAITIEGPHPTSWLVGLFSH